MATKSKWKTDWSKCCLCQEDTGEDLKSPPKSYSPQYDGYRNITTNVPLFKALNALPIMLDPARLDEGGGIEETLKRNKAKYHQSCRLMFNSTKLERARKRMSSADSSSEERSSKIQRTKIDPKQLVCFLCEKEAQVSELRQAMTMQLNHRLNECARNLNNGRLLAILSGGDVVAQELKYHPACLAGLYNQERAHLKTLEHEEGNERSPSREAYPLAFSEFATYITETKTSSADISPSIFKLEDLASLYKQRLEQLGVVSPDVNSTRVKETLLREMPELEAHQKGRNVLLAFHKGVG